MPDRDDWIAFVSEEVGEDEAGPTATALFSVLLERQSDEGASVEIAGDAMSLDDALVWARKRASRVLVRRGGFGDQAYTAGDVAVEEGRPLADALPVEPRRLPGWEFVDRTTADAPISWDVVVEVFQMPTPLGAKWRPFDGTLGEQWATSLARLPIEVVELRANWAVQQPSGRTWVRLAAFPVAVLRVQARTVEEARSAVAALISESIETMTASPPWSLRAAAAYATGSAPARANARVGSVR